MKRGQFFCRECVFAVPWAEKKRGALDTWYCQKRRIHVCGITSNCEEGEAKTRKEAIVDEA